MKRWFKVALKALLLLVALLVAFLLFERWRGQISLARFKLELAARGETLDVLKLIGPPVADEDNGASEFLRLKDLIRPGKIIPNDYPPRMRLVAPGKAMVGWRENFWLEDKKTNSWEEAAPDLATNKQVLDDLRLVLAKPAFDFKLDHSRGFDLNLVHLSPAKSLCQWFGAACQDELRKGENQAALDDLLAALAALKIPEHDHVVISEMVRNAMSSINFESTWEALQANVWTDEQLASLQRAWESNTFGTNMALSLRVERADANTSFEHFPKSNEETYKNMFPVWPALDAEEVERPHWWQGEFVRKQIYCQIWRFAWLAQDEKFYFEGVQRIIGDRRAAQKNWLRHRSRIGSVWLRSLKIIFTTTGGSACQRDRWQPCRCARPNPLARKPLGQWPFVPLP